MDQPTQPRRRYLSEVLGEIRDLAAQDPNLGRMNDLATEALNVYHVEARPVLVEIAEERARQDAQFGGPATDDALDLSDWLVRIDRQLLKFCMTLDGDAMVNDGRECLIKVAALCVAAIESTDRKCAHLDDLIDEEERAAQAEAEEAGLSPIVEWREAAA